jgi:hypothetical protein
MLKTGKTMGASGTERNSMLAQDTETRKKITI